MLIVNRGTIDTTCTLLIVALWIQHAHY